MFEKIQKPPTAEKGCQKQQPVCRRKELITVKIGSQTEKYYKFVHLIQEKTQTDFSRANGLLSFENDIKMK